MTSEDSPSPNELRQLTTLFQTGHHAELESEAGILIELHPNNVFAWKALGLSMQAQVKDAVPALQRAVELDPNDAQSHFNLGVSQQGGNLLEAAAAKNLCGSASAPSSDG